MIMVWQYYPGNGICLDFLHTSNQTCLKFSSSACCSHYWLMFENCGCNQVISCFSEWMRRGMQRISMFTPIKDNFFAFFKG